MSNHMIDAKEKVVRRIVCAANRHESGYIILGIRHWDTHMHIHADLVELKKSGAHWEQGFVDQFGAFYNRKDAMRIAMENNQIIRDIGSDDELYSEHLY